MPTPSPSDTATHAFWHRHGSAWPAPHDTAGWLSALLQQALDSNAQELYLAASPALPLRYRIDGVLVRGPMLPAALARALIDALCERAGFAPGPTAPQRGRLQLPLGTRTVACHLSRLEGRDGLHLHLRLHDDRRLTLPQLGFDPQTQADLRELCRREGGLTLIAGPAASGKRSTLYTLLDEWNPLQHNLMVLEERGGRPLPQATQIEACATDQPLPALLPALLAQNPDVLVLDELYDAPALQRVIRMALRGQSVLLRCSAPDLRAAIRELLEQGISANLLADALNGVIEQRLLRRLCERCATAVTAPSELEQLFIDASGTTPARHARGCPHCHYSGYRGQLPLVEVHRWESGERHLLRQGRYLAEAEANPQRSFDSQCREWLEQGITDVAEVDRVFGERYWQQVNPFAVTTARRLRQAQPGQLPQPTLLLLGAPTALAEALTQRCQGRVYPVDDIEQAARLCHREVNARALLVYLQEANPEQQLQAVRTALAALYLPLAFICTAEQAAADVLQAQVPEARPARIQELEQLVNALLGPLD